MAEFFGFRHEPFREAWAQADEQVGLGLKFIEQGFRASNLYHAFNFHGLIVSQQWLVAELICREVQKLVDRAEVILREKRPVIENWLLCIEGGSDCNLHPVDWFQPSLFGELRPTVEPERRGTVGNRRTSHADFLNPLHNILNHSRSCAERVSCSNSHTTPIFLNSLKQRASALTSFSARCASLNSTSNSISCNAFKLRR